MVKWRQRYELIRGDLARKAALPRAAPHQAAPHLKPSQADTGGKAGRRQAGTQASPELREAVLDGAPRHDEAVYRLHLLGRQRHLRIRVPASSQEAGRHPVVTRIVTPLEWCTHIVV